MNVSGCSTVRVGLSRLIHLTSTIAALYILRCYQVCSMSPHERINACSPYSRIRFNTERERSSSRIVFSCDGALTFCA